MALHDDVRRLLAEMREQMDRANLDEASGLLVCVHDPEAGDHVHDTYYGPFAKDTGEVWAVAASLSAGLNAPGAVGPGDLPFEVSIRLLYDAENLR
ncbi:MAG TPA: hypothetical protein VF244_10915 [Acidimicrobiales bacterium]